MLNTICSQNKGTTKSVLINQKVRFPGKKDGTIFIEISLNKILLTPFMYTISDCKRKQSLDELIAR
jgi:hypothetical protein